jgi:pimeloyl-ACP methyl ester carboxylesterase
VPVGPQNAGISCQVSFAADDIVSGRRSAANIVTSTIVPSWFLVAEDDRMIVPETQHYMAQRMKAKMEAHVVDHTPSVTAPSAVVDIIRDAMRSVTGS